ncbi:MAG: type II toxin-antitoxin system HicA family toxin [Candidatus Gracilibacteria bacterium]|nr:type II toxin-antitoxin system HicA family toxin [Candidatus Gracilibacteria bacterium]
MPYSYKEIEKKLLKLGYKIVRQNGSHVIFCKGDMLFPVPKHSGKDISIGIENKIIKNIGIYKEDFKNL